MLEKRLHDFAKSNIKNVKIKTEHMKHELGSVHIIFALYIDIEKIGFFDVRSLRLETTNG